MSQDQNYPSDHDLLIRIATQQETLTQMMTTRANVVDTRLDKMESRVTGLEKVAWMLGGGLMMLSFIGATILLRSWGIVP